MLREWWQARQERTRRTLVEERLRTAQLGRALQLTEKVQSRGYLNAAESRELRESLALSNENRWVLGGSPEDAQRAFERGLDRHIPAEPHKHQKADGSQFPFFESDEDLDRLRDESRDIVGLNLNAKGLLRGLRSYTIGHGATVKVVAKTKDEQPPEHLQEFVDELALALQFPSRQTEHFTRSRRDGDSFMRLFQGGQNKLPKLRFVWPEQIRRPSNETKDEWSFGIHTEEGDSETVIEYAVHDLGSQDDPEIVPADEIIHTKINVDSGVKRGIPDFCMTEAEQLQRHSRLSENMGEGSANQAAIAYIRQHAGQAASAVQAFADSQADRTTTSPVTGKTIRQQSLPSGTVVDTGDGMSFVGSPYNAGVNGHLSVAQAQIRNVCVKWNAPEWLGSADASNNNFASSLTAESPFVIGIREEQKLYCGAYQELFNKALAMCVKSGLVRQQDLDAVNIEVSLPDPTVRNPLEKAQSDQIKVMMGSKSPQIVCEEDGDDWERVQKDMQELHDQEAGSGGRKGLQMPDDKGDLPEDRKRPAQESRWTRVAGIYEAEDGKRGFTGYKRDSIGRNYYWLNGRRVKRPEEIQAVKAKIAKGEASKGSGGKVREGELPKGKQGNKAADASDDTASDTQSDDDIDPSEVTGVNRYLRGSTYNREGRNGSIDESRIDLHSGDYEGETVYRFVASDSNTGDVWHEGDWTHSEDQAFAEGEEYAKANHAGDEDEYDKGDHSSGEDLSDERFIREQLEDTGYPIVDGLPEPDRKPATIKDPDKNVLNLANRLFPDSEDPIGDLALMTGAPEGAEITVTKVGRDTVKLAIRNERYTSDRTIGFDEEGRKFIHNDYLRVKEEGTGLGRELMAKQVYNAADKGFDYLATYAAKSSTMDGYSVWPHMGYNESLKSISRKSPWIAERIVERFPGAESIQDVVKTKEGQDWWKQNGSDLYNMIFNLKPGSRSRSKFDEQIKRKHQKGN
jgi:hypothetical protein